MATRAVPQRLIVLGLAVSMPILLATCASVESATDAEFDLSIQDNLALQRFDVVLTSTASTPLCLSKESWPEPAGLPLGFDGAVLSTSSGTKALLPTGSAYCPGGCGEARIESGQQLAGAIGYAAFGDAAAIAPESPRVLAFQVRPYRCR